MENNTSINLMLACIDYETILRLDANIKTNSMFVSVTSPFVLRWPKCAVW